jgi:hypothetical protein
LASAIKRPSEVLVICGIEAEFTEDSKIRLGA